MKRLVLCLAIVAMGCVESPVHEPDAGACLTGVYHGVAGWSMTSPCTGLPRDNPFEKCALNTPFCLPYELPREADGAVDCIVLEQLPDATDRCADLVDLGRDPEPADVVDGREVCNVRQVGSAAELDAGVAGYYATDDPVRCLREDGTSSRLAFTTGAGPLPESIVRVECLVYREGDCR